MNTVKQSGCWGVPLAEPRVALSATSPRADYRAVGFSLQSLTRNASLFLVVLLLTESCSNNGKALQKRCVEQFTKEENLVFVNADGYCECAMPKLVEYCETNGIDLVAELNKRQFFQLALLHPELDRYTKECMKASPPEDLSQGVFLSEKMKLALARKYALPLQGSEIEKTHDINGLCQCLVDSMNGNMTVGEFLDESFYRSPRYQNWVEACKRSNAKH